MNLNEDIVLSMASKLEIHGLSRESRGETCTIYKVPDKIKEEYPGAYEPQIVSIGPFHHGNLNLLPMERIKWKFLRDLIGRHESNSLDKYINAVSNPSFVQQITKCYSKQVMEVDGRNTFVEMMVLDGCFIIEFLVKFFLREPIGGIDFRNWNFQLVKNDLLLIENQIPFSVIQALFNSSFVPGLHDNNLPFSITDLAKYIMSFDGYDRRLPPHVPPVIHHYLHLRHYCLCPTPTEELRSSLVIENFFRGTLQPMRKSYDRSRVPRTTASATELKQAGIRFRPNMRASSILDVTFGVRDGLMEIPVLTVTAASMSQFRNLIALEQYLPDIGSQVTSFVLFINCLINTPADITILVRSGVLETKLGSEEVVLLFNTLAERAYLDYDHHYLGKLYKDVKHYCSKLSTTWRAQLIQYYFTNPWTILVVLQSVIALMLSILQSMFTILAYFYPPKSK